jgi:hypothetical protein
MRRPFVARHRRRPDPQAGRPRHRGARRLDARAEAVDPVGVPRSRHPRGRRVRRRRHARGRRRDHRRQRAGRRRPQRAARRDEEAARAARRAAPRRLRARGCGVEDIAFTTAAYVGVASAGYLLVKLIDYRASASPTRSTTSTSGPHPHVASDADAASIRALSPTSGARGTRGDGDRVASVSAPPLARATRAGPPVAVAPPSRQA